MIAASTLNRERALIPFRRKVLLVLTNKKEE